MILLRGKIGIIEGSTVRHYRELAENYQTAMPIEIAETCRERINWSELADRVLDGGRVSAEEGLALLRSDDAELMDILAAAYRVRYRYYSNEAHLNYLVNAKSGNCSEDCGYCSQSRVSKAEIKKYELIDSEKLFDGARIAAEIGAKTYCMAISGRSPNEREIDVLAEAATKIKARYSLGVCASIGLISLDKAKRLKSAGVDRINHNLNTSRNFYPRICSTHSFEQRLENLRTAREAGLQLCSGGIVGMGEEPEDVVDLALTLSELQVEALPVNFLQPIDGTPLEGVRRLNPRYCLKALSLFRLANPKTELRIAGGREMHLRSLQPLGLLPANSIFLGDYLTTPGQAPSADMQMIDDLGFKPVTH